MVKRKEGSRNTNANETSETCNGTNKRGGGGRRRRRRMRRKRRREVEEVGGESTREVERSEGRIGREAL